MKALICLKAILLLFVLLSVNTLIGQSSIGIRAGVMSSKQNVQDGNITEDYKSKLGADIAFVANFPIGIISISPEFHWLQKGGKIEDLNGTVGEVSRTFNYLEIPLLFKLNFGKVTSFFICLGLPDRHLPKFHFKNPLSTAICDSGFFILGLCL